MAKISFPVIDTLVLCIKYVILVGAMSKKLPKQISNLLSMRIQYFGVTDFGTIILFHSILFDGRCVFSADILCNTYEMVHSLNKHCILRLRNTVIVYTITNSYTGYKRVNSMLWAYIKEQVLQANNYHVLFMVFVTSHICMPCWLSCGLVVATL